MAASAQAGAALASGANRWAGCMVRPVTYSKGNPMRFVDLEETARLLAHINPAVARRGYDAAMLVADMQSFAFTMEREGVTRGSTFGYCLTLFKGFDGETVAHASLTPYVVESYLKSLAPAVAA